MSQIILSLIFGALIGFSLGLLGGGGSILTVPILVYVIGQDVHAATGTSLAIVGGSALVGALAHSRKGDVRIKSGLAFGLMSMIGALPGVWLNRLVAGKTILLLFAFIMIVVAMEMLRKKVAQRQIQTAGVSSEAYTRKDWLRLLALGLAVGLLTGFFGVGGGFLIVPALVLVGNLSTHQAVGTSLLVIAMASVSGFLGHLSFGNVNITIVGLFVLGGLGGVLSGTALAGRVPEQKLAKAFGWFTILVALYLFYENLR
jgi:uncharacterized membrane protein YfcA